MIAAALLSAALVAAVLWYASRQRIVTNDRQPSPVDRLAAWERKMGEYRAEQRRREHRVRVDFDHRATVQPKVVPKLPK